MVKTNKAITLVSLIIYIFVMIIAISVISTVLIKFKENNDNVIADCKDMLELNNFNLSFLKEVKLKDNKVDKILDDNNKTCILFKSGNSFLLNKNDSIIYNNNIQICKNVDSINFALDQTDDTIINVTIMFKDDLDNSKNIKYKIEDIY